MGTNDNKPTLDLLIEKWDGVLKSDKMPKIESIGKEKVVAQLLENTQEMLKEAGEPVNNMGSGDIQYTDPVLISLIRRLSTKLIAFDVCGIQPMRAPTQTIFSIHSDYVDAAGAITDEALFNEADTAYSGKGTHAGTDPNTGQTTGTALSTAEAEGSDFWREMKFNIDRTTVTAGSRQLRASYSKQLEDDLRAVHGLDAKSELSNILSNELISEINREVIRTIYSISKAGATNTTVAGTFDLDVDSDGRWLGEKVKGLCFQIDRDCNQIGIDTRRGKGNVLICSSDVAVALELAGALDYSPALAKGTNLDVDPQGNTFVGIYRGKVRVYIDPYATVDFYVVGYKGQHQYDAGMFYCPYRPLEQVQVMDTASMQPIIGFRTRYGIVANPFTNLNAGQNVYYRKVKVTNLL